MRINWTAISATVGLAIIVVGWGVSIEVRISQATDVTGRLKSIEEALYPILVDYRVKQIVGESGYHEHEPGRLEPPIAPNPDPEPPIVPPLPPRVSIDDPFDEPVNLHSSVPDEVPATRIEPSSRYSTLSDIHIEAEDWAKQQLPAKQ